MRLILVASLALFVSTGCGTNSGAPGGGGGDGGSSGGTAGCSGAKPAFAADVQPILQRHCGGGECHAVPYSFLTMATTQCSDHRLIAKAGDPQHSYLIDKLTGQNLCNQTRAMPPGGTALPAAEVQTIYDWICAGAKND
jgi:hypothetical protein